MTIILFPLKAFTFLLHHARDFFLYWQGALKVRRRVTLMVLTVSAIFGICWGIDTILHLLEEIGSYKLSPYAIPIAHTMIMFNSTVNPFAYALINQRFREKMKGMIYCTSSSSEARAHAARKPNEIEMINQPRKQYQVSGSEGLEDLETNSSSRTLSTSNGSNMI